MEMSGQPHSPVAFPPIPIKQQPVWTPEASWIFWRRVKFLVPAGIQILHSTVTIFMPVVNIVYYFMINIEQSFVRESLHPLANLFLLFLTHCKTFCARNQGVLVDKMYSYSLAHKGLMFFNKSCINELT
jgi:hypothetical protein